MNMFLKNYLLLITLDEQIQHLDPSLFLGRTQILLRAEAEI